MFNARNISSISKHAICIYYMKYLLTIIDDKAIIFTCEIIINNLKCEIINFVSA